MPNATPKAATTNRGCLEADDYNGLHVYMRYLPPTRREIITVRGQFYVSRLPKY